MCLGIIARGVLDQQCGEANRFVTNVFTHKLIAAGGFIPLVEQQIERLENGVQASVQLFSRGNLEADLGVANPLFGPRQSLRGGRFGGEKCASDLCNAKSAQSLQGEGDLGVGRYLRVTTNEH